MIRKGTPYEKTLTAARKQFGSWRAFFFSYFLFNMFMFWGTLLNILGGIQFYSIPQYILFVVVCGYAVYLAERMNAFEKTGKHDAAAALMLVVMGVALVAGMAVLGYWNEYWADERTKSYSMGIAFAIILRNEAAAFIRGMVPGYLEGRKRIGRLKRWVTLALSLTVLPLVLAGWGVAHFVVSLLFPDWSGYALLASTVLTLVVGIKWLKELLPMWGTGKLTRLMVVWLVALMVSVGFINGALTAGGATSASPLMPEFLGQIILWGILAQEALAVLTMWYIFLLLPTFYPNQNAR